MSGTEALRESICRVGRSLHARGYVHATAGNISARCTGGFLITPTDACLGTLEPAALARVDDAGRQLDGGPASKTLALHLRVYAADAGAACIVHTHSTNLVALTLEGVWSEHDIVPPITPYFVMKVGHVPLVAYHRPGDPRVAGRVAGCIADAFERGVPIRAVMLERLGPLVWHRTPEAAGAALEELEETARLWRGCTPRPAPLSPERIDELRRAFGAAW